MGTRTAIPAIIAIDGPAGSGKSTLGKNLAEYLGYLYFDTGVMYRAVTLAALDRCIPIEDELAVTALAEQIDIDVRQPSQSDGRDYDVWVDGKDVTWEIRRPEVEAHVSVVSAYPGVRRALGSQQRRIGLRGEVVMVGRDIGTVVLPEAGLKIYLDASVEERARRRYEERSGRGEFTSRMEGEEALETVLQSMRARDAIDSTRQTAPLRPAQDAIILNSDGLDAEQVLGRVKRLIA
jgi:cytidylate kinase